MAYDNAAHNIRREINVPNVTGIASTTVRKVLMFQKSRIKKVHGMVVTAGTNDVAGFDILNGTTSVGAITFGTATAGSTFSSGAIDSTVEALGHLDIKGKATSATLVASLVIEHEVLHDAVQS